MTSDEIYVGNAIIWELADRIVTDRRWHKIRRAIRKISMIETAGWPVGFEMRCFESGAFEFSPASCCDDMAQRFGILYRVPDNPRVVYERPHTELAALRLWSVKRLTVDDLNEAVRLLGGDPGIRDYAHYTMRYFSGHRIKYLTTTRVESELNSLIDRINAPPRGLDPIVLAICVMLHFLVIHPFKDGNGRLSRLLFQYVLHRNLGLRYPLASLYPAIESEKLCFLYYCLKWEIDSSPEELTNFVVNGLQRVLEASLAEFDAL